MLHARIRRHRDEPDREPARIDLDMEIKNFGPISHGRINLKPLTIFVGPNNSGKSYAATLVHSILSSENNINFRNINFRHSIRKSQTDVIGGIYDHIEKNRNKICFTIPVYITNQLINLTIQSLYGEIDRNISRNFNSSSEALVRNGSKAAKITIHDSPSLKITIGRKIKSELSLVENMKYEVKIEDKPPAHMKRKTIHKRSENGKITLHLNKISKFFEAELVQTMIESTASLITHKKIPSMSHYFPAARSGILQGHKAISASIIRNAQYGGLEDFEIPKLPGPITEFISNIIDIDNMPGPFSDLAEQLEMDLLEGRITMQISTKRASSPEIEYEREGMKIPLHRTSSTVSEIAPFSLYLKHIVRRGDLLIIEEPEAHLHPENQAIFARYIIRMIRMGLNVLVTTHSVFLVEQLGQYMLASRISPDIRINGLGYQKNDYLGFDEVAPYVFTRIKDGGHKISPIEVYTDEGISQEEFVKVDDMLYSNALKIKKNLPKE